jgi:hypothetical protein
VSVLLIFGKTYKSKLSFKQSLITFLSVLVLSFAFEFYNFYNLPLIDFRAFKEGVNIKQASEIPEDAEQDVYETVLYYKNLNTGESEAFTIDNIPYEDTLNWAYDTTITELISKGYEPPIHDFFLTEYQGEDVTDQILDSKDPVLIFVLHDIKKELPRVSKKMESYSEYAEENGLMISCFTASGSEDIDSVKDKIPQNVKICTGDFKMLKTMIRSNPGFVLLKDAVLLAKYHYRNIPEVSELNEYK